jgi:1-acyl-sn-glycerol-3-phosphate acyltransferase
MKKIIASTILKLLGWKTSMEATEGMDKCVMIAAPHTSNWDFPFTILTFWKHDIRFSFFIKDSYTKSIFGGVFRAMGAIGVDRSKGKNLVDFASDLLKSKEKLVIIVPAEGTRSYVQKWKTGFYYIAKNADVPIALGFLDFKEKLAGVGPLVYTSNNMDLDFKKIEEFYKDKTGKNPELYNPIIRPSE